MAINPMQRKANNSFLLGILVTLLITGIIIGLLILQLSRVNKEMDEMRAKRAKAYVLNTNVKSGEIITSSMLKLLEIDSQTVPANAIAAAEDLMSYSLCDKEGNPIDLYYDSVTKESYYAIQLPNSDAPTKLTEDATTGKYYYEVNKSDGTKNTIYVDFAEQPLIAKVDLNSNTLLTSSLIARGELVTADVRTQEYNIISLPSQITSGDFIDVRLRMPNGQDYIVVSHKEVTIPTIEGVDSASCIWIDMTETDTLNMSAAIIEAYKMNGAKLYATKYVEAGYQDAATPTYLPPATTIALLTQDPNALQEAKNALFTRYRNEDYKKTIRNPIDSAVNNEDAEDNLQKGVQEEIQGLRRKRKISRVIRNVGRRIK